MTRAQTYRVVAHLPSGVWIEETCAQCDCILGEYGVLLGRCPVCRLVFCAVDMWRHGCPRSLILREQEEAAARARLASAFTEILSMGRGWTVARQCRMLQRGTAPSTGTSRMA